MHQQISFYVWQKRPKRKLWTTHLFRDQHTKWSDSMLVYCTTARRKSSTPHSHQLMLTIRNRSSSFMLLNSFHRGVLCNITDDVWSVSKCFMRDRSSTHNPREEATAIDRPLSFPIAAIRQGPLNETYEGGTRTSSHWRETSCAVFG